MNFVGTWHIYEMEAWGEDYFNMEVQAFITINKKKTGEFQFGLVQGDLDGEIVEIGGQKRFEFTFEGSEEYDHVCGSGWIIMKSENEIEGKFTFHLGDHSLFKARRTKK